VKKKKSATRAVESDNILDERFKSISPPIYKTSSFAFSSVDEMITAFEGKSGDYIYTRISNPTIVQAERKLAELEAAESAVLFSSGMAVAYAVFVSLLQSGDHMIVSGDIYGGTATLLKEFIPKLGVDVTWVDLTNDSENNLRKAYQSNSKLIFFETPTNPTIKIVDIQTVARHAHEKKILTVTDNTFASPINQNPLTMGVDIVFHSATKYLGGHDDITAGVVMGSEEFLKPIRRIRTYLGSSLEPETAWLLLRGVKTLDVRMQKHNTNAMALAMFLGRHPKVKRVFYPGLEDSPYHAIAKKQMSGFGGMLSFEIDADKNKLNTLIRSLKMVRLVPSLGGVETTILLPAFSSHFYMSPEDRKALDISDGLVRVNTGIEDIEDIKEDFDQALKKL